MSNNKKYVSLARLSNFLENIKSKYSQIGHKHTIADLSDYRVDTALSPTSSNPVANSVLDAEFDAMATAIGALELAIDGKANSSHNHNDLYYTETEVDDKLASKADSSHSHNNYVPTSRTVNGKALSANISLSASDVGALPNTTSIPDALSDLSSDSTHRTVTDAEKAAWNAKSNFSGSYNDLTNKPTIPSVSGLATETYVNDVANNKVDKVSGKGLSTNDYTTTEKNKLSGIASGAEVNQNAFSNVVVGTTTIAADSKTDSLTIAAGDGVSVSGDATNDKITITNSGVHSISTGSSNGTISVNTNGTSANVAVKGLGSAAYTASTAYDAAGTAQTKADAALASAKSYTDTKTSNLASTTVVDNKVSSHNTSTSSHSDIRDLITGLTTRLNTLANSDDTTLDQMSEVVAYIKNNKNLIDGITTNKVNVADIVNNLTTNVSNKPLSAAQGVAIKNLIDALQEELDSHGHAISDVSGLQSALDSKAASSHGTHVSYSTTAPVMDGTASVGSASTVARSDHKHPTDTSRASKTEFDTHTADTTKHITATERTNWNAAKTHADSAHAPSNAEKNQNAFSNIKVGSTTVAADTATDTLELVGSNVTITPDATNDKITIAVASGSTSSAGILKLTNSTSSTSTTTAATPSSVKSAYDLANTAKTNAATAQTKADSAYTLAESKVDSLSDLGITATATELNYVDGVTSSIQTQLDGKAGKKVEGQTITVDDVAYVGGVNAEVFNDYEANVATGAYSHAEGCYNKAFGDYSHAEGALTVSSGYAGHAEGYQTKASGAASHAEGKNTAAIGQCTHAEGISSTIVPDSITSDSSISTVETAWNSAKFTLARGIGSHAEGSNTLALSTDDHSEGYETIAKGGYSHAQGYRTKATGGRAHAEGQYSLASGNDSHAEGTYTIASGASQHVQGKYNIEDAAGKYAHIVGGGSSDSKRSNVHTLDWSGNAWFKNDVYIGGTSQDDASKVVTEADKELLLPKATISDNGKVLRVVDGAWTADESGGGSGGNSANNNVTLTVSGWNDNNEQTVNVSGVTATNTIIVGGDLGSEPHYTDCGVYCSGQGNGTLTFKCTLPPSEDLIANVAIL